MLEDEGRGMRVSKSSAIMLSEMEKSLENMVEVYHRYSLLKGNNHALYKDDFKKLVTTECPHYMKKKNVETMFKELDINQDKAINFEEYLVLVVKMGVAAHADSHKE
ncbi:protein S100-A8 isoform X1 [Microtus ochrogaster]|uniref:Protein S100 n=2 Tax=Microtus ochrogaster TaxID=79684 RepID=A0ABM0LJC4_MICOH|nr:protein S100-A8 isoform X1 [Microtus ochrogaster]